MKNKIFILVIILMLFLTGCDNRKCIKSHKEKSVCSSVLCSSAGNTTICHPITFPCTLTVCDEYEEVND